MSPRIRASTPILVLLLAAAACRPSEGPPRGESTPTMRTPEATTGDTVPGIQATNLVWYYRDLEAAHAFYTEVMGFETVADLGTAWVLRVAGTSYLTLADEATAGPLSPEAPRSVTLALVTEEVQGWWDYLRGRGVATLGPYRRQEGRPYDGFVAVDPEGYYLEVERFNRHPENEALLPLLDRARSVPPAAGSRPPELGVRATVVWLYYEALPPAQRFWEELLGVDLLVDQGWAKVYPATESSFVGLVDGARGLHEAAPESRVTVGFLTREVDAWQRRARALEVDLRSTGISESRTRIRSFLASGPGGYRLEWGTWLPVDENQRLLELLRGG